MRQLCGLVLAVLYRGKLYWKHEEVTIDEADKWGIADVEEIVAYRKKTWDSMARTDLLWWEEGYQYKEPEVFEVV